MGTRDDADRGRPGNSATEGPGGSGGPDGPGGAQARRRIPRTDAVLADPRLAAPSGGWARPLVKRPFPRPGSGPGRARSPPDAVADAAVAGLPPRPPR